MEVIFVNTVEDVHSFKDNLTVAHGFFDGVHIGHQELILKAREIANSSNTKLAVVTFNTKPSAKHLCHVDDYLQFILLTSMERKIERFEMLKVDYVFVVNFLEFNEVSAQDYIDKFLKEINTKHFVMGEDNRFGYRGEGNSKNIAKLINGKFSYSIIASKLKDGQKISSSTIRRAIASGRVKEANELLGYYYQIKGTVLRGKMIGRTIGFPTANIQVNNRVILPKIGAYATVLKYKGKEYLSMTNIGYNPTIKNGTPFITLETHVIGENLDLYDEVIELFFIERLRDEKKFSSVESLIEQLKNDRDYVLHNIKLNYCYLI